MQNKCSYSELNKKKSVESYLGRDLLPRYLELQFPEDLTRESRAAMAKYSSFVTPQSGSKTSAASTRAFSAAVVV